MYLQLGTELLTELDRSFQKVTSVGDHIEEEDNSCGIELDVVEHCSQHTKHGI